MTSGSIRKITALALIASLMAVWQIGYHWLEQDRILSDKAQRILDAAELKAFVDGETASKKAANFASGTPILIPTGVFVQSIIFNSAADVNVTGYIWQKYPKDFRFEKGFIFPEQISSADTLIREEYTKEVMVNGEPHDLIGSYFDVTMRQSFDYTDYPLDFLTIWIRLWPEDFENDENILFVPDFSSYATDNATEKASEKTRVFGLDPGIVQGEWEIDETFFSYHRVPYNTNFGFRELPETSTYNEFYFNLGVKRKFMNAFIINLVPLFVVGLLLFSALMTISKDENQASRFGFSTSGLLGTCSALFFVVMLSHVQVRSQFAGSGLVYIEYFYLAMYVMILLSALNGYLFSLNALRDNRVLSFGDNLIAKVSFWPLLLWSMVFITWWAL